MKLIVAATFLASAALVMAQGGGGGGRGGFGGQRGGFGGGSVMQLLGRNDVQKDLKLTDDQKKAVEAAQAKQREQMQAMMEEMRNGGGQMDREAMQKMMAENTAKQNKEAEKILTPEQWKRAKQIQIQLAGAGAVLLPDVQKELGLTQEQLDKIKALQAKQQEANNAIMEKMRNQEIDREEAQASRTKNNEIFNAELQKILTDANKAKLKELEGPKFAAEPQQGRGPGGGGN